MTKPGDLSHYAIRGGVEGRDRLRVLARVLREGTQSILDRLGVGAGWNCLDVGCGGGDVTFELARRVGPMGQVVGVDIDATKIEIAAREAGEGGIRNIQFRLLDVRQETDLAQFDLVYSRFLLTHLDDPGSALDAFYRHLKPGGLLLVEDIDFRGQFVYPENEATERYQELYRAVVKKRGGDADIGPRLPSLLKKHGFAKIGVGVVHHVGLVGEAKLINPLTMEAVADAVIAEGLATADEIERVVTELYAIAADDVTLVGLPRVFQVWGYRNEC